MRIAIDATIIRKEITGTGFYIVNLLNGLVRYGASHEYFIFCDKDLLADYIEINKDNFHIIHKRFRNRIFRVFWQYFIFPLELKRLKVNLLHSPNYITPLIKAGFKIIVTIHDITFILFPEKFTITKRLLYKIMVPFFIKISDKVISVSENTKKDLISTLRVPEEKIAVTYETIPEYYYQKTADKEVSSKVLKKYGINKGYILFVGMIEPRKNIISLLKAFYKLDSKLDLDLVIVGKKGWYYKDIEAYMAGMQNKKMKNSIIFTDYVPESEVKILYEEAVMFVYPALYEGFGLPPLQAMACGTPVITSNISSLPEVVGDAAIKVDPKDVDGLARNIILLSEDTVKKEELAAKGFKRSEKFGIENITIKTLDVYNHI